MVALTSLLLVGVLRRELHGLLAGIVAWLLLGFALVAGAGVVLGAVGQLSTIGFWCFHLLAFAVVLALRYKFASRDFALPRVWLRRVLQILREDRSVKWTGFALIVFCLITVFLAAAGQPAIYDSITYRLSRIAHWLQEGAIGFFPTNEPRQNYMPITPDVVMAWILGATPSGYAGVALAQWAGGILLLAATVGLGRLYGLSRFSSLAAACMVAGAANVAPQFTTAQTDLITAGFLAASVFFWRSNARLKQGSILFGLAAGLALSSKGTVFYLLPGLAIMALWYAWRSELRLKAWRLSILSAFVSIGLFFLPGIVRNYTHYDGPFGPEEFVAMHHQTEDGRWIEKTKLNLASFFIQSLEPHSQMPGLARVTQALASYLVTWLPEEDPFTYEDWNRREVLSHLLNLEKPDADGTTFGLVLIALFAVASVSAVVSRKRRGAGEVRILSLGLLVALVFFHAMQLWHPFGHRYFILAAPWIAIVGAWFLQGIRHPIRKFAWGLVLFSSVCTASTTLYQSNNAGRVAAFHPELTKFLLVHLTWTDWLNQLPPAGDTMYVALPFDRPLAPFYRREKGPIITLVELEELEGLTLEQAVSKFNGAWLLTSPELFLGDEGNAVRRQLLFNDDPGSGFSLGAYRIVDHGDRETP